MRGHHKGSRGRGRQGGRGRGGRGRGGHGRGGRRELIPTRDGFLYRPETNVDYFELEDDFRIYGQFSSDEQDSPPENLKKKKHPQQKKKGDHKSFEPKPSKGQKKTMYLQPLNFQKSSESPDNKEEDTSELDEATLRSMADLSLKEPKQTQGESSKDTSYLSKSQGDESTEDSIEDFESDFDESEGEDDLYRDGYLDDTEEDELLEEDMLIMEDYVENMLLQSDEDLEEFIASTRWQEEEEEPSEEYDYDALNETKDQRVRRILTEMEEEEAMMTKDNIHKQIMKSSKKKIRDASDAVVDPEIFGQTLEAAISQVPPSLRPGMRAWYEKQQKREEEKKKKKEMKEKRKQKQKGKNKEKEAKEQPSLIKIDKRLRDFIQDASIASFEFAPMPGLLRKQVHILSEYYNLYSKGTGHREIRHIVVRKTPETYLPANRSAIDRYISEMQTSMDEHTRITQKQLTLHTKGARQPKNNKKKEKDKKATKKKGMATHGTIVGQNVAPIGDDNIGHRMLAAMGWQQGQALGTSNNGITAPLEAVIRRDKLGLGL